jgi:hypothetical protein
VGRVYRALLVAAATLAPGLALAQPEAEPAAPPVIIRGSSSAEAPGSGSSGSRLVLRGTPPPVSPPAPIYTCPPSYLPDPSLGCVLPGLAYAPSDVDYWPYIWPYYAYALPRRFGRATPMGRFGRHVVRLGPAERFAHR